MSKEQKLFNYSKKEHLEIKNILIKIRNSVHGFHRHLESIENRR